MPRMLKTRRTFIATAGAALAAPALMSPVAASGLAPTPTMRGGSNNYRPGAPIAIIPASPAPM